MALIGVRSVLGFENETGSPFNIQRSLHILNLTYEEVEGMFQWYTKDSGRKIEPGVIKKLFEETRGQPGLTCWLGELLSEDVENYPIDTSKPIRLKDFENIYQLAINILPNNNILNIIGKADTPPYRKTVLTLFNTGRPMKFRFDKKDINFLYMNGVIEPEVIPGDVSYVRFASPFVQKRLFNYFSGEIFSEMGQLVDSFECGFPFFYHLYYSFGCPAGGLPYLWRSTSYAFPGGYDYYLFRYLAEPGKKHTGKKNPKKKK